MGLRIPKELEDQILAQADYIGPTAVIPEPQRVDYPHPAPAGPNSPRKPRKKKSTISEKEFQQQVIEYAQVRGWKVAHFRPGMTKDGNWVTAVSGDGKGFPDTLLIRRTEIIVAELKVSYNKPSKEQQAWLTAFSMAGVEAYVWWPEDWEQIEKVLADHNF